MSLREPQSEGRNAEQINQLESDFLTSNAAARAIGLIGRAEEEVQSGRATRLGQNTGIVIFEVQPTITESASANYAPVDDIRQAASMLIYMGSPSREFTINGRFVSRTKREADRNWKQVQILKSWRMPEASGDGAYNMKSPSRLTLTGFASWFNQVKVRMTSCNIEYPEDVDYIRSNDGYDVPIIWPVTVTLKEARSPTDLKRFDIKDFRKGQLNEW